MVGELFGAHAVDAIWDAPRAAPRAAGSNGSPHTDAGGGPGVKRRRDVAGEPQPLRFMAPVHGFNSRRPSETNNLMMMVLLKV